MIDRRTFLARFATQTAAVPLVSLQGALADKKTLTVLVAHENRALNPYITDVARKLDWQKIEQDFIAATGFIKACDKGNGKLGKLLPMYVAR